MVELVRFRRVDFHHFKAFEKFRLDLRHFNILVGPNNAGKSTVLAAFRILAAAMRRASARRATRVVGPGGRTEGHIIDLAPISVAEENIFFDYDDSAPASVRFRLTNGHELTLYFPEQGACILIPDAQGSPIDTPTNFKQQFNCPIGFVPILGPVEHNEQLYERDAARQALYSYRAARNFRNIWHHYPQEFGAFRTVLRETWPGMDIERPTIDFSYDRPRLHMFCPEDRIPRELFWAGFGFQVWCQMLTHVIQSKEASIFLIDEPDIYLHSELQRQLLGILRNLGPDILLATHSTEIVSEAEADDIVLINKRRKSARRIKHPSQLSEVFATLGSNLNPVLTQIAKTRKVVFVEGKDFQIFSKFARKLHAANVANRSAFAVLPIWGFNPERARNIEAGIETTLGGKVKVATILDRDYRSQPECSYLESACKDFSEFARIHHMKEVENFLLVPDAIDRAASRQLEESNRRTGKDVAYTVCATALLDANALSQKGHTMAQFLAHRRRFARSQKSTLDEATINEDALAEFERSFERPYEIVSGKAALASLNAELQNRFGVTVTPTAIIDAMKMDEIPQEMVSLIRDIAKWSL